jgi:hypothetical protein
MAFPSMDVSFTPTIDEFRRAHRHIQYLRMGRTGGIVAFSVLGGSGLIGIIVGLCMVVTVHYVYDDYQVPIMSCFFGMPLLATAAYRSLFVRCHNLGMSRDLAPVIARFDDQGVTIQLESDVRHWSSSHFNGFEETPDAFFLMTPTAYLSIPIRAIPPGQLEPLREVLREQTAIKKTLAFPVQFTPETTNASSPVEPMKDES